jgi:hypothetical protein
MHLRVASSHEQAANELLLTIKQAPPVNPQPTPHPIESFHSYL